MKSIIFFTLMLFALTSCDKNQIAEEDPNGFDEWTPKQMENTVQMEMSATLLHHYASGEQKLPDYEVIQDGITHRYFDRIPTDQEVLSQYVPGMTIEKTNEGFEVYPEGTKRAANPKIVINPGAGFTMSHAVLSDPGVYCTMGTYSGAVSFVLNANPLGCNGNLYHCNDGLDYIIWRSSNTTSSCHQVQWRYLNESGVVVDTKWMGVKSTGGWRHWRCKKEGATPGFPNYQYISSYGGPCAFGGVVSCL